MQNFKMDICQRYRYENSLECRTIIPNKIEVAMVVYVEKDVRQDDEDYLRHQTDAIVWKEFDKEHTWFAEDSCKEIFFFFEITFILLQNERGYLYVLIK